jgi:hypothetical protein
MGNSNTKCVTHTIKCPECKREQTFRFDCSIDPCIVWQCYYTMCGKVFRVVFNPIYCLACTDVRHKFCGPLKVISNHDGPLVRYR